MNQKKKVRKKRKLEKKHNMDIDNICRYLHLLLTHSHTPNSWRSIVESETREYLTLVVRMGGFFPKVTQQHSEISSSGSIDNVYYIICIYI